MTGSMARVRPAARSSAGRSSRALEGHDGRLEAAVVADFQGQTKRP
jgi:hypothetical protein